MIDSVFSILSEELNEYFEQKLTSEQGKVVVSALPTGEQTTTPTTEDNLIVSLVNIEQDRLSHNSPSRNPDKPVNVYLYILFAAGFSETNYEESLKMLSATIAFFQENPVFSHENTPNLDPRIDKLCFEMINLNIQELSQLWGIQGGKYYPSVLYRARVVSIKGVNKLDGFSKIAGFGSTNILK